MSDQICYGIDLRSDDTIFCHYPPGANQPLTVSSVVGGEVYQIPTVLARVRGNARWVIGEEARRLVEVHQATQVQDLYQKALHAEKVYVEGTEYEATALLARFLSRLFSLSGHTTDDGTCARVVFCVSALNAETVSLFHRLGRHLQLADAQVQVISREESFYYFLFHQEPQVFLQDVMLFDDRPEGMDSFCLHRNQRTSPQSVHVDRQSHGPLRGDPDAAFAGIAQSRMEGKTISGVYLTGDGFDGDWMRRSLEYLCKGRRVFAGKNLYAKGACYCAHVRETGRDWPFVYYGEEKLRRSVGLRVQEMGKVRPLRLLSMGESWYEAEGSCELILDDRPELTFYIQEQGVAAERPETVLLSGLPQRPPRTTRIRVNARPLSNTQVEILVTDLGFGELFAATGKQLRYVLREPAKEGGTSDA